MGYLKKVPTAHWPLESLVAATPKPCSPTTGKHQADLPLLPPSPLLVKEPPLKLCWPAQKAPHEPSLSSTFCAPPEQHRDSLTPLCHLFMCWKDDLKNKFPIRNPPSAEGGCCKSSGCTVCPQSRAPFPASHRKHHPGFSAVTQLPAATGQNTNPHVFLIPYCSGSWQCFIFRSPAFSMLQTE